MLKKENRLTTNFEFSITKKYGKKVFFPLFNAYFLVPNNYQGPPKVGIVVPNTVSKKAAKRNLIKRHLRETTRKVLYLLPNNLWVVIYANAASIGSNYEEINSQVNQLIQKISITH